LKPARETGLVQELLEDDLQVLSAQEIGCQESQREDGLPDEDGPVPSAIDAKVALYN
jgi:hypothetical protein